MRKNSKTKRPRKTVKDWTTIKQRKSTRLKKMQVQNGLCYYCGQPMWEDDAATFCRAYDVPARHAAKFRCTAEHLHAVCEGGVDSEDNIVAAHSFCNWARHHGFEKPSDPDAYAAHIRESLAAGAWPRLPFTASAGRTGVSTPMRSDPGFSSGH